LIANPFLGVFLHAVGGLAAGSFYIPYKKVRSWAWESYWLVGGVFAWLIMPSLISWLTVPDPWGIIAETPASTLFWTYLFGALWGVGGLTFGLTMRYLGMSLGMALALGFCAAFGTVVPPVFEGNFDELVGDWSGLLTLMGTAVCLAGIAVCGKAGMTKERELPDEAKKATIEEFNFSKGIWLAVFAGVLSACMAFGIAAGEPIAERVDQVMAEQATAAADQTDLPPAQIADDETDITGEAKPHKNFWRTNPVYIVIFAGGFTTNFLWCLFLNLRNRTSGDYVRVRQTPMLRNYLFSASAGTIWYFQFFFYGMGTTRMGQYDFSSWTIHMAFIIVFSNMWGLILREWLGTSKRTHYLIFTGISVLILSTLVVGAGNYLAEF
jgi:L-rhamnose-H+ transport protein